MPGPKNANKSLLPPPSPPLPQHCDWMRKIDRFFLPPPLDPGECHAIEA